MRKEISRSLIFAQIMLLKNFENKAPSNITHYMVDTIDCPISNGLIEVALHCIKNLHWPGIEPGPPAWQARILPLNHQCSVDNKADKLP